MGWRSVYHPIGVARIFRGCVRSGVDPGFVVGGDGGAEGPERGALGGALREVGSGEGRRSASTVWGLVA